MAWFSQEVTKHLLCRELPLLGAASRIGANLQTIREDIVPAGYWRKFADSFSFLRKPSRYGLAVAKSGKSQHEVLE
jgi:hypothetical protein